MVRCGADGTEHGDDRILLVLHQDQYIHPHLENSEEFVENISLAFELQNNEMEYFRSYLSRIVNILK